MSICGRRRCSGCCTRVAHGRRRILGADIEALDLAGRRARVQAKGARPLTRRRGAPREDFVLEQHLLGSRHGQAAAPVGQEAKPRAGVHPHRKPGPGKVVGLRNVCPDTGLAGLSYRQARALPDGHPSVGGVTGTGWNLYEWRHPGLTHPGEAGASLPILMAKSRHKKPENVQRSFHPSAEATAEITILLAPGGGRR